MFELATYFKEQFFVPFTLLVVAGGAIGLAIYAPNHVHTRERAGFESIASVVALVSSVAGILVLTLRPLGGGHDVQLLPLGDLGPAVIPPVDRSLLLESASNILLFLPLGAALRLRGFPIAKTVLTALVLSAAVEIAQLLFISGRTTSVDDLLLNLLGAILGYTLLSRLLAARRPPP